MSSIDRHREFAESRLRQMVDYAETDACRRAIVLRYFGEDAPDRCAACDNCAQAGEPDYPIGLLTEIENFRDRMAQRSGREPTRVFELRTARELARQRPHNREELLEVWGVGETRANWLGDELLRIVSEWERANPDAPPRSEPVASPPRTAAGDPHAEVSPSDPLYQAIRAWRLERARTDGVPAFTLFSDRTLRELTATRPTDHAGLLATWGLGEAKVRAFGDELLGVIARAAAAPAIEARLPE